MMKRIGMLGAALALGLGLGDAGQAEIKINNNNYHFVTHVAVRNNTAAPVTFELTKSVCATSPPELVYIPAGQTSYFDVTQKFNDTRFDNCYGKMHVVEYRQYGRPTNFFRIKQHRASNYAECVGLRQFYVLSIASAMCPEIGGAVKGGYTERRGWTLVCPALVPNCPPHDNGTAEWFGFMLLPQIG